MNAPSPCRGMSILPPPHPSKVKLDPDPDQDTYADQLRRACVKRVRVNSAGRPSEGYNRIMLIMADGRERTANDIAHALNISAVNANVQLGNMARDGQLLADRREPPFIYRKP